MSHATARSALVLAVLAATQVSHVASASAQARTREVIHHDNVSIEVVAEMTAVDFPTLVRRTGQRCARVADGIPRQRARRPTCLLGIAATHPCRPSYFFDAASSSLTTSSWPPLVA